MSAPTVRAKFMCSGKEGTTVFLHTVYSEDIQSEDRRFTKATPCQRHPGAARDGRCR